MTVGVRDPFPSFKRRRRSRCCGSSPNLRAHTIEHSATCHADSGVMASDDGVQREAEIAQEVEAIEDLLGLRGTGAHALGEDLGAVAGDDLDTGMSPQPPGDTDGIPVRQQVDDGMPFEIDDHGPVAPPASPSPLVDPDDARLRAIWHGRRAHEAQERVTAHRHGEAPCQASGGSAAESEAEMSLKIA
jgi:hypothetical protein